MKGHLHRDRNIFSHISCLETWTHETTRTHAWTRSTQKLTVASGPRRRDCSIPQVGPFAVFLSRSRPRFWKKKKVQKFLGDQIPGSGPRPRHQVLCTEPHVGMGTPGAVQDGLLEIWLSHLLQLSLVSSVHTWHCLKPASVLQKIQNQTWWEQGSKDQPERGSAEGRSLPVHPFKGLYHWDCLISKKTPTYFLLI